MKWANILMDDSKCIQLQYSMHRVLFCLSAYTPGFKETISVIPFNTVGIICPMDVYKTSFKKYYM